MKRGFSTGAATLHPSAVPGEGNTDAERAAVDQHLIAWCNRQPLDGRAALYAELQELLLSEWTTAASADRHRRHHNARSHTAKHRNNKAGTHDD